MEIAILVFFIAIFGGVLFLLALVWFIFRRIRNSRSAGRNFSSTGANYGGVSRSDNYIEPDDDSAAIYAGSSLFANQDEEKPVLTENVQDSSPPGDKTDSHESHGASAAPFERSYPESSSSSYDSGSSYDSVSSSDSGSSSGDSGSSSSSSD